MPAWIFQGTPDRFDVAGYVQTVTEARWLARQHADEMKIGDTVYLWQLRGEQDKDSGIVGVAKITTLPRPLPDDPQSVPFWVDQTEAARVAPRVDLRVIERSTPKRLLKRDWLKEDPICADLPNIRFAQNTNYPLSDVHSHRLARLWSRTGETFDRLELLLCLQAYTDVLGQPISMLRDSPVWKASLRMGRVIISVYSKLRNFHALDPRNEGKGLTHLGQGDREVWEEFWTGSGINTARLSQAISALEQPGSTAETQAVLEVEASDMQPTYSLEGRRRMVTHLRIERNIRVVQDAKAIWFNNDPDLRCSVCGLSFRETYGDLGEGYIEAHHRQPLGQLIESRQPSPTDLDPVCANCHRMLHRNDSLTLTALRLRLQSLRKAGTNTSN